MIRIRTLILSAVYAFLFAAVDKAHALHYANQKARHAKQAKLLAERASLHRAYLEALAQSHADSDEVAQSLDDASRNHGATMSELGDLL